MNNLLGTLQQADFAVLEPYLKTVRVRTGAVLQEQGAQVNFTYFPCGGSIVAFEVLVSDGRAVETNLIGREGAVGGIVGQAHFPAHAGARVIFGGEFLKISIGELERSKARSPAIARLIARYSDCLLAQVIQSAACNATHSIEQRAAKWLCFAIQRTGTDEVPITQEQLAHLLGATRTYVSRVLQRLRSSGAVETRRGVLCVRDPLKLKLLRCDCHDYVGEHFEAVLKDLYPRHVGSCATVRHSTEQLKGGGNKATIFNCAH